MRRAGVPISVGGLLLVTTLVASAPGEAEPAASTIHGYREGPPAAYTGGFGEPTCQACHTGNDLNAEGGELRVSGVPDGYRPGDTYLITVLLRSSGMAAAGFQATLRFDGSVRSGEQAGTIVHLDARTHVSLSEPNGVQYIHHLRPGTTPTTEELASWSFEWTAPEEPLPVILHITANSANGDDSPLGDLIYTLFQRIAVSGP